MVKLVAKMPEWGVGLPVKIGAVEIAEIAPQTMVSVAPFKGRIADVSALCKEKLGGRLPEVGCLRILSDGEIFWSGMGQWMWRGAQQTELDLKELAAVTDQSDAWAGLTIRGETSRAILARLCPLDLRDACFAPGQVARTEFAHMMSIIISRSNGYDVFVMRSFAQSALHHLMDAAKSVKAQNL